MTFFLHPIPPPGSPSLLTSSPSCLPLSRFEALYPVPNPHITHDKIAYVFHSLVKIEKMMFENASSRVSPESWAWSLQLTGVTCFVDGLLSEVSREDC